MPFPLVFRRIAQLELDESVSWYENKRMGLGREFRLEIEKHLEKIANEPKRFAQIRGQVLRVVLATFSLFNIFLGRSR